MAQPILQIENLHKKFKDTEVLKGVDLALETGDVVSIIGSSGSGKTTLLRCVNMLEEFHQGRIRIDGEEIGYSGPQHKGARSRKLRGSAP
jgi:polar amino acid transport system ATP-binding protein